MAQVLWHHQAAEKDIAAAQEYLTLKLGRHQAEAAAHKFRKHQDRIDPFKAKDLMRSSGLPLLAATDEEVAAKLAKITQGKKLDPVLLVRDGETLHVADGYHRICAAYHTGEDTEVACVLVHTDKGVAV
jgi:hypothetical protein